MQTLFRRGNASVAACACPRCGNRLPSEDINVAADTALCRGCGGAYRFSDLVENGGGLVFDPFNPPHGASFQQAPCGFSASATTRSALAWFLVPFMCVWSGFSLGGIYGHQIVSGHFDLGSSLFGIPFVLGTLLFGTHAAMSACGHVSITRNGDSGRIFEGIGPLGWVRRFRWSDLESVSQGRASYGPGRGRQNYLLIVLNLKSYGRPTLRFGTLLSEDRRGFLIWVLRSQLGSH